MWGASFRRIISINCSRCHHFSTWALLPTASGEILEGHPQSQKHWVGELCPWALWFLDLLTTSSSHRRQPTQDQHNLDTRMDKGRNVHSLERSEVFPKATCMSCTGHSCSHSCYHLKNICSLAFLPSSKKEGKARMYKGERRQEDGCRRASSAMSGNRNHCGNKQTRQSRNWKGGSRAWAGQLTTACHTNHAEDPSSVPPIHTGQLIAVCNTSSRN